MTIMNEIDAYIDRYFALQDLLEPVDSEFDAMQFSEGGSLAFREAQNLSNEF